MITFSLSLVNPNSKQFFFLNYLSREKPKMTSKLFFKILESSRNYNKKESQESYDDGKNNLPF